MTDAAAPARADWLDRARTLRPPTRTVQPVAGGSCLSPSVLKSLQALDGHTQLETTWEDLA